MVTKRPRSFAAVVATLGLCIGLSPVAASPAAAAYNGNAAAAWADAHWNHTTNPAPSPYFFNNPDCTNFISIAMHVGGGFPYVSSGAAGDSAWWYKSPSSMSRSWLNAFNLYNFLMIHWPGGFNWATTSGNVATPTNNLWVGDLVFFNWGQGEGISHVAMEAGAGSWTDQCSAGNPTRYGDYIDQHTTDRYHQAWNGYYCNSLRSTTTVYSIHIDGKN